jgi:hypothetical protein
MSDDKTKVVGILDNPKYNEMTSRVYDDQGIAPTIQTMDGGGKEPKIRTICLNPKIDGKQPGLNDRVYSTEGVATAVTTCPFFMGNIAEGGESHMRIRKLTEGECLRLQGFQKRDKEAMAEAMPIRLSMPTDCNRKTTKSCSSSRRKESRYEKVQRLP